MTLEKASHRLFFSLFFIYTMNCFGKIAFSAVTAALVDEQILTKTQAGTVGAMFWILYAAGQFIGGSLANKFSPAWLLGIGIFSAAVCNFLMAFCSGFIPILIIWSINGLLQFGVWPSILRMVSSFMLPDHRAKALNKLAYCYAIGSIFSYLCTAAVLAVLPWNYLFICCGVMSLVSLLPLVHAHKRLLPLLDQPVDASEAAARAREKKPLPPKFFLRSGLLLCGLLFILRNMLETGIKSWTPTILMETFGAPPQFTSLLSVCILLLNLTGVALCAWIFRRTGNHEPVTAIIVFSAAMPLLLPLLGYRSLGIYVTTILLALSTVLFYGSGQIFSMYYPSRFGKLGATPFIGGVMNCFAATGNVISTYANGALADRFGWDVIVWSWVVLLLLMILLSVYLLTRWKKIRSFADQA